MDSDSDSPEATGAAWLPKLSINKHLERAGRPWAVIRWWLSVKMAFFIFGLSASHLPTWPPQAQYLMCCKTL